ncbi:uncharacterized protein Tco025E_01801 [Trypanosoma conorhini]|uniref:Uncharacterized protein n=1 Tax=Trypanosoma conorhini TaxID=83891 RepID=A0A422Q7J3_9TRYP|nr:uncharacterized protein Tco025E_01801 [Trypanosoma conorhini]RNF25955.1 hypothetical protein Tco025E_01801 [Trypanosoma conorhini]
MKQAASGRKATAKARAAPTPPGSRSKAAGPVPASGFKDGGSRPKGVPARGAKTNAGRRPSMRSGAPGPNASATHGTYREAPLLGTSMYLLPQRRRTSPLGVSFFCSFFVARMRRTIDRYRQRVKWEAVEKPRAAFLIQTAWRKRKQRRRMRLVVLSKVFVPLLRRKLGRIRAAKESSALLLQRVFRSQKERHFMHWLYQQMKYGRALALLRMRLKRYVARQYVAFLALQRDERVVWEERCAMASLCIIRDERKELLWILRCMKTTSLMAFTPLGATDIFTHEETRSAGCCSLPPLSRTVPRFQPTRLVHASGSLRRHEALLEGTSKTAARVDADGDSDGPVARNNSGSGTSCLGGGGALVWTSLLHNEEGARQLVRELFAPKEPCYPLARTELRQRPTSGDTEKTVAKSFISQGGRSTETEGRRSLRLSDAAGGRAASAKGRPNVAFAVARLPLDDSGASVHHLMEAFISLLICTESTERKALELELQSRQKDLMKTMNRFVSAIHASHIAPAVYLPLLSALGDTWVVRRAEQLFREEYEARLKLVEEYQLTPLRFLNRPLLNLAAEERRRRLQERLQTMQRREKERVEHAGVASLLPAAVATNTPWLEEGQAMLRFMTDVSAPGRPVSREALAEASTLKTRYPTPHAGLPQPAPPSPPPRRAHENAVASSVPLATSDGSARRRAHRHGNSLATAGSPAFSYAVPTEWASLPGHLPIGPTHHDAFADGKSGAPRDTPLARMSPTPIGHPACPIVQLPAIAGCQHRSTKSTEIKNGTGVTEIQSYHTSHRPQFPTPRLVNECQGSLRQKRPVTTRPESASGGVDATTTQKGGELGIYSTNCGSQRGVPIPLLRYSSRPERSHVFAFPRPSFALGNDSVTGKESGADYVRIGLRCPSPNRPATGLTGVGDSIGPTQSSSCREQPSSFRVQSEQASIARKQRRRLPETSSLSFVS